MIKRAPSLPPPGASCLLWSISHGFVWCPALQCRWTGRLHCCRVRHWNCTVQCVVTLHLGVLQCYTTGVELQCYTTCVSLNCCVTPILTCCCSKVDHKLHFWDHGFIKFQTELEHYIVDGRKRIDLKVVLIIFQHNHIYQACWKVARPTYPCIFSPIQGTRS